MTDVSKSWDNGYFKRFVGNFHDDNYISQIFYEQYDTCS